MKDAQIPGPCCTALDDVARGCLEKHLTLLPRGVLELNAKKKDFSSQDP